jgi:hypothetical protein
MPTRERLASHRVFKECQRRKTMRTGVGKSRYVALLPRCAIPTMLERLEWGNKERNEATAPQLGHQGDNRDSVNTIVIEHVRDHICKTTSSTGASCRKFCANTRYLPLIESFSMSRPLIPGHLDPRFLARLSEDQWQESLFSSALQQPAF